MGDEERPIGQFTNYNKSPFLDKVYDKRLSDKPQILQGIPINVSNPKNGSMKYLNILKENIDTNPNDMSPNKNPLFNIGLNVGGGFKKTNRRKSLKRKSNRRKSNRRKSLKKKSNRRKSSKRLSRRRR